ncbi:DISARM system phospholipase D-like protein DrmC [Paracoccaceae bacterium]|nr:DISARM system phospholipase D-like protein DrmC [Paracoccaceae bacterium]
MKPVLDTAFELAKLLPPSRVEAISNQIMTFNSNKDLSSIASLVNTTPAKKALQNFLDAWQNANLSGETGALILQTASDTRQKTLDEQKVELVLTGPSTSFVATRKTEQVLLDLIREAKRELFMVSFVAYNWDTIIKALQSAVARGVDLKVLLEASKADGGSLDNNPSEMLRKLVPQASIYQWTTQSEEFLGGKVHAKIAVADAKTAFVTSANLTGHAMEKNFEAGLLVDGGEIPRDLSDHIQGLIEVKVITKA